MKNTLQVVGVLAVAVLLAACGGTPVEETHRITNVTATGIPVVIAQGNSVAVDGGGLELTFTAVTHDSRCPTTVECIWEGVGIVEVAMTNAAGETATVALSSHSNHPMDARPSVDALGYTLTLVSLDPYPLTPDPIPEDSYSITVEWAKTATADTDDLIRYLPPKEKPEAERRPY
ncbi:MAG TPA: hypothetical protein VLB27_08470 [candidate division Zixibacteria bacterium]|nr:hypothetical protein [candidate division Zixibacteria bacterium]